MQDPEGSHYIHGLATPWSRANGEKESYASLTTNHHTVWSFATLCYIMSLGWMDGLRLAELGRKDRMVPFAGQMQLQHS